MAKPTRFAAHEPLNVYQDSFFENASPMISHAPMPSTSKPPRRPLQNTDTNVVLNPPIMFPANHSPLKPTSQKATNPTTPLKAMQQGNKLNMVSFKPPQNPMRPTDCIQKKQPLMSRFKTVAQKPVTEGGMSLSGKENARPMIYPAGPPMNLSIESYYQKPTGKRLLEPAPIKDSRPQKKLKLEDSPLPPHDSFPTISDDGTKPGHSYATLIGMAILRSPHRRLTLSQIYKWISDTYSFYNPQDAGWQNSIRHNLSLNKAFVKQERPKDDPGKGNYWAIEPGMEHQFMKEKPTRKSTVTAENLPVMTTLEPSMPLGPAVQEPVLPPQLPVIAPSLPNMQPYHAPPAPLQPEPSSDATIPVSDSAAPEETLEKTIETDAPFDSGLYSPLPAAMHSSPPIPRHVEARHGTPPPVPRQAGSSITRSHKRKFASMDDSGYISSLESSVLRGNQHGKLLTSEADRPRMKRRAGRAEEEIARLRASSYDSPSKGRSWNGLGPQSSSPLRQIPQNEAKQMRPPRTPAIKLKAPPQPPPSNSPNTNLRIHRDKVQSMLQSPLRRMHSAEDDGNIFFTPNQQKMTDFSLEHHDFNVDLGASTFHNLGFDILVDDMPSLFDGVDVSPVKRSAKRMRLDRTQSAGILGEVTNPSARKTATSAPFLKAAVQSPAIAFDTPSKAFDGLFSSPSKYFAFQSPLKMQSTMDENDENAWMLDDLCGAEFLQDTDEMGLDILQGFEKIGAAAQAARPSTGVSKPALGRSYTSNF